MNNHNKMEKAKTQLQEYSAKLQGYEGNINKWKVIGMIDKVLVTLGD